MTTATTNNTNTQSSSFTLHDSIKPLMDRYDGFILDQYGVMHNGSHGLAGAPEAVAALHQAGKKIIILSNSSALADNTIKKLPKLGFDPGHFVGAVTSGQEASRYLRETYTQPSTKILFLTWDDPTSPQLFLDSVPNLTVTDQVDEAELVVLHGAQVLYGSTGGGGGGGGESRNGATSTPTTTSLGDFFTTGDMSQTIQPLLEQCRARNLPMVCCNPDFIMIKPDGTKGYMPGTIAQCYQQMLTRKNDADAGSTADSTADSTAGSTNALSLVTSFGKPHREHFEACIRDLELPAHRVVHVGDSLHHDIQGANAAGVDSIFVLGGVHLHELATDNGGEGSGGGDACPLGSLPSDQSTLQELFAKHGEIPTHVVPMLRL